jgi:hypothetical protein
MKDTLGIMKKNSAFYLVYTLFFLAVPVVMWYSTLDRLRTPVAVLNSFFMFFAVVVPALSAEIVEEKYKSYAFLMTLPLRLETVVRAKMALPVIAVAVTVAYNFILFRFFQGAPSVLADCQKIILLNASLVILLSGGVFLLMYRFNVRVLMTVLVFTGVLFQLLGLIALRARGIGNIFEWPELVVQGRPAWIFALMPLVALGLYHLIFVRAVRLKQERMFE